MRAPTLGRLRDFLSDFSDLLETRPDEPTILSRGGRLLAGLVSRDDWLPDSFARPAASGYAQHLLYGDPRRRFSVVSFAWGPGQGTPVHDHTVWGLVGMLRGSELTQTFERAPEGLRRSGPPKRLSPGAVEAVSPTIGDVHQVRNALSHATSVSIHVYGGDIGAIERRVYEPDGSARRFVSGYSSVMDPALLRAAARVGAGA